MMRKYHVRFGGGRLEKEPQGHLVSRLPNSIDSKFNRGGPERSGYAPPALPMEEA